MQTTQMPMPTNAQAPAAQPQLTILSEVINQIMQAIQQQSQVSPGKDFQSGYYGTATPQPCPPDVPVPLPTPQPDTPVPLPTPQALAAHDC